MRISEVFSVSYRDFEFNCKHVAFPALLTRFYGRDSKVDCMSRLPGPVQAECRSGEFQTNHQCTRCMAKYILNAVAGCSRRKLF